MTELEKIAYAKLFIDKLAMGVNPLDNTTVPENDLVKNERISRCFTYVSGILGQVINNGGYRPKKRIKKTEFSITREQLEGYEYFDVPVSLSEIIGRINELVDLEVMKKLSYRSVAEWLTEIDVLREETDQHGRMHKHPTEKGRAIGISIGTRVGEYGPYPVVIYDRYAQEFLIDNMEALLAFKVHKQREK